MDRFVKAAVVFRKCEKCLLVVFVAAMSMMSVLQIILRRFFRALPWMDSFLNYSVLWVAMIAAGIVTYEVSHIKIDIIGRIAKGRLKESISALVSFFAGFVSDFFMVLFTVYLVVIEYVSKVQVAGVHSWNWIFLLILPIGFLIISVRMFNRMIADFYDLAGEKTVRMVYFLFSLILSLLILICSCRFLISAKAKEIVSNPAVFYGSALLCALLLVFVFVVVVCGCSSKWRKRWLESAYILFQGIVSLLFFIYSVVVIIDLNCKVKVYRVPSVFTDTQMNLFYLIPVILFFSTCLSFALPFMERLRNIYPKVQDEQVKGEEQ